MPHSCCRNLTPKEYCKKKKIHDTTSKKSRVLKVHIIPILKIHYLCAQAAKRLENKHIKMVQQLLLRGKIISCFNFLLYIFVILKFFTMDMHRFYNQKKKKCNPSNLKRLSKTDSQIIQNPMQQPEPYSPFQWSLVTPPHSNIQGHPNAGHTRH